MREINFQFPSHICHTSVYCIKEFILFKIIFWIEPFFFQFSPKRFGNIKLWTIGRKKEQEQSSFLPIGYSLLDSLSFMYSRIIQNYKCCFTYFKRKLFQIFQHKSGVNIFRGHLPPALVLSADESQAVNFIGFFGQDTDLFIRKLPSVRNIAFTA